MTKNITLMGASYSDVPGVELPQTGGGTAYFTDVSDTTATASDVASGKYFYTAAGVKTAGAATGGSAITITDTLDAHGGIIREITAVNITNDTVTAATLLSGTTAHDGAGNAITGEYVAPTAKNTQVIQGTTRSTSTTLAAIGSELTVSKTGTYDIYWSAARTNTSSGYTWGTQLYLDGTAHGSENTTWSNHVQNNHLTNVSLTENQKLRVYGRGRGGSYYIYAPMLAIVEV